MKLLINLPPDFFSQSELKPRFESLAERFSVRKTSHNTPEEIAADLLWADAVIMWSWPVLDEELLERAGDLKYLGHIDITQRGARAELARGIPVSTSRSGFSLAVAEMALGLILTTLRKISDYHVQMRLGAELWVEAFPKAIDPLERQLTGATVGIIGFGQVGRRLAHFLKSFEVDLKVVDPHVSDAVIAGCGGERMNLDAMLRCVDICVLCAASNEGTVKIMNGDRIARMKRDSIFINVARGTLVDTDALIKRLQEGDFFAALDVFEEEPLPKNSILRTLPNVYLTPHRGGGLISSVERNIDWLIEDLENVISGKRQKYPVLAAMISSLDA